MLGSHSGRRRRRSVLRTMVGIGVVGFFAQAGWATLNFSALPMWVQYRLHQGALLGLVIGAFIVTEASLRPVLGAWSDRIGHKPVMLLGPTLGIFTSVATPFMPNAFLLVPLRALDGIGLAGFWPAGYSMIADTIGEERRGTGTSVLTTS